MAFDTANPLRVGLVGAGPWANFVHAPMLAAGPDTILEATWARRPEAAHALAEQHGATVAESEPHRGGTGGYRGGVQQHRRRDRRGHRHR